MLLQRAGVAAFVVLTEPFRHVVDAVLAFQETDRPLPSIVLDHPIQNVTPDVLEQRSIQLADAAERLLRGEAS